MFCFYDIVQSARSMDVVLVLLSVNGGRAARMELARAAILRLGFRS